MYARRRFAGVNFVRHLAVKLSYTAAPKPPAARAARLARSPDGRVKPATAASYLNPFGQENPLMDRITLALVIAQNGLRTAATLLAAKAAKAEAASGTDPKAKKEAAKAKKLAAALSAADAGITSYLTDTGS